MITAAAQGTDAGTVAGAVIGTAAAVIVWLLPVIVAAMRKVPNIGSVAVVDILLSWTIIGWVVALAMACRSRPQPQVVIQAGWQPPSPEPPEREKIIR
jgi:Superinfection immunity protein